MTEILFAIGAGPEVVGVCRPASYPPEAGRLPAVASWERVDVERIVALAPKACFSVEGMQAPEPLGALDRLGVPVVVYPMRSLNDLWACMEDVGHRTAHGRQAGEVVAALRARVAAAGAGLKGPPRRALVVVGLDPVVAAGKASFLGDVLAAAGFANALEGSGDAYPILSLESAAAARPDAVVFPTGELDASACDRFAFEIGRLTGRRVAQVGLPADLLVRAGPRTAQAVERLARERRRLDGGPP